MVEDGLIENRMPKPTRPPRELDLSAVKKTVVAVWRLVSICVIVIEEVRCVEETKQCLWNRKTIYFRIAPPIAVMEERRTGVSNRVDPITTFVDAW